MSKADAGTVEQVASFERAQIERAQAGDREMLKALLTRHSEALFSKVILPRVGDRAAAEDILKATMVTAIEKIETFRWQGRSIYFWLRQVAVNKVIDYHRATQRGRRLASSLANEPQLQPTTAEGPEAALIAEQEQQINRARITETLGKINPRYRQAIELRLIQELPREKCAEQLDVTVGTFDVVFFRALKAFRAAFGER